MTHHSTLVQRLRATDSLLADEFEKEFTRLENDRADAADDIARLKKHLLVAHEDAKNGWRSASEARAELKNGF